MVPVGSPTGWCLPSPCVQWGKATCPSAVFLPTTSTNGTTWISTNTGLCVCCICAWYGCGCSLVPSPHFHFEISIKIWTRHKARIWICAYCVWALVSVDKTGSCMYCTLLPMLNVLVPPQVGVFPPHVSSGARPPVPQHSTLQPVVPQVCMCVAHVCRCGRWGWVCACEGIFEQVKYCISLSSQWSL